MAIVAVSSGETAIAAEEKKLYGLLDESGAAGGAQVPGSERRTMRLKGIVVANKTEGITYLLDGKAGKVLCAILGAAKSTTPVLFNNAGSSTGASDGIEISSDELYVKTTGTETLVTAYIEE